MEKLLIRFNTIEDVRNFVDITSSAKSSVELIQGNYSVDGKSIMGIFGLDLKETVTVLASGEDCSDLVKALGRFAALES